MPTTVVVPTLARPSLQAMLEGLASGHGPAPAAVIVERLATRTGNPYGKRPEEVTRALAHKATVEPLLPRGPGHEIDTRVPLEQVVERVLRTVEE